MIDKLGDNSSPSADIPSFIGEYLPTLPARSKWALFCCDGKYIGIGEEILLIPKPVVSYCRLLDSFSCPFYRLVT